MIIATSTLRRLCMNAIAIVDGKSPVTELNCFRVTVKSGEISVTSSNIEVQITETAQADLVSEFDILVNAHDLTNAIKAVSADEIDLDYDGQFLKIKSKKQRFKIATISTLRFPQFTTLGGFETEFTIGVDDFARILKTAATSMNTDSTYGYLCSVLVDVHPDVIDFVSTNGKVLTFQEFDIGCAKEAQYKIPDRVVTMLSRRGGSGESVTVSFNENVGKFAFNGTVILSKLVAGAYPEYRRIFPGAAAFKLVCDAEDVREALKSCLIMGQEDRSNLAVLKFGEAITLESVKNEGSESVYEFGDVEIIGDMLVDKVGVNAKQLVSVMDNLVGEVQISFSGSSKDPIDITDGRVRVISMPVLIN